MENFDRSERRLARALRCPMPHCCRCWLLFVWCALYASRLNYTASECVHFSRFARHTEKSTETRTMRAAETGGEQKESGRRRHLLSMQCATRMFIFLFASFSKFSRWERWLWHGIMARLHVFHAMFVRDDVDVCLFVRRTQSAQLSYLVWNEKCVEIKKIKSQKWCEKRNNLSSFFSSLFLSRCFLRLFSLIIHSARSRARARKQETNALKPNTMRLQTVFLLYKHISQLITMRSAFRYNLFLFSLFRCVLSCSIRCLHS